MALTVAIASCTFGDAVFASEIKKAQSNKIEIESKNKTNSEFVNTFKIIDSNISFKKGHYSFNKDRAIKQGLSSEKVNSITQYIDNVNNEIDNGTINVSTDGKKVEVNNQNEITLNSAYDDDDDYTVVYDEYLGADACNAIGDALNDGSGWLALGATLAAYCPHPYIQVAAKFSGVTAAVAKVGGSTFKRAARNGGAEFSLTVLTNTKKIAKAFLRY